MIPTRLKTLLGYHLGPKYLPAPSSVSINLTPHCNLKCRMCWQYGERGIFNNTNRHSAYPLLSLTEWSSVIDELANFHSRIMLWGGEPFLYPQLLQLLQYIKGKSLTVQLITNGALLKEHAASIVSLGVEKIVISIDGTEELHDQIRGVPGTFQRVTEGILELDREKKLAAAQYPQIVANFTISPMNHSRIIETVKTLEALPVQSLIISHLWFTTRDLGEEYQLFYREVFQSEAPSWQGFLQKVSEINLDTLAQQINEISSRKNRLPVTYIPCLSRGQIRVYYREPNNSLNHYRCLAPWRTSAILPNGDVTPCADRPDFIVGNIRDKGFKELWHSERYNYFRKVLKEQGLFPLCYRCCELFLH